MRLYLSSFRMGSCRDRLVSLAAGGRRVAVVANSMDSAPAEVRAEGVRREVTALADLGFDSDELDLRHHFGDPSGLAAALGRYDVVWARGGNTFMLRHAMARSGADERLRQLLRDDAIVYSGYSAGPCVLGPSLRGLETVDDPAVVPDAYGEEPMWDGLGVLDYAIVPHVDSPDHPESEGLTLVAERYAAAGVPHRTLRDGQVLVVDGDTTSICG